MHARRPNVWPREHLPELQPAFEALGRRVVEVGLKLAALCDMYVQSKARTRYASPAASAAGHICIGMHGCACRPCACNHLPNTCFSSCLHVLIRAEAPLSRGYDACSRVQSCRSAACAASWRRARPAARPACCTTLRRQCRRTAAAVAGAMARLLKLHGAAGTPTMAP